MTASSDVPAPDRPAREVPVSHQPPAGRTSRAGRDLGSAILVGLALGAIILVPLLTVRQTFVGVLAAATAVVDADEDEVAFSIALVTLCGTLAILVLPVLREPLRLDDLRAAFDRYAARRSARRAA